MPLDQGPGSGGVAADHAHLDPAAVGLVDPQATEAVTGGLLQLLVKLAGGPLPADAALRLVNGDPAVGGQRGDRRIGRVGQIRRKTGSAAPGGAERSGLAAEHPEHEQGDQDEGPGPAVCASSSCGVFPWAHGVPPCRRLTKPVVTGFHGRDTTWWWIGDQRYAPGSDNLQSDLLVVTSIRYLSRYSPTRSNSHV